MTASNPTLDAEPVGYQEVDLRNRRLGFILGGLVLFMLAMAPVLYWTGGMLCDALGIGWNPGGGREDASAAVSELGEGEIYVEFVAQVSEELRGDIYFFVNEDAQRVQIGAPDAGRVTFTIRNGSDETQYLRPIHYVSPAAASRAFRMTECFCYNDMALRPGESRELLLVYGFRSEMDVRVKHALVSYVIEPITRSDMREQREMPDEGNFAGHGPQEAE